MLAASQIVIPDERVTLNPEFIIINRLKVLSWEQNTVFVHKRVEYDGKFKLVGNTGILVRVCLVQPRLGGQEELGHTPTAEQVFGQRDVTIATPIGNRWIGVSDRHYFVMPGGRNEIQVTYEHRLSNNLSLQEPTLGGTCKVSTGPIFMCAFSDLNSSDSHVIMHNMLLRTIGTVSFVPFASDIVL